MKNPIIFRGGSGGSRIYLGPVFKEDLPSLTVWINDPEISQFLTVDEPMTEQDEEKWLTSLSDQKASNVVLAIRLVENNEIIGTIGLYHISFKDGTATMGYCIGRKDLWGKGYGTEAQMVLLEYAFNTLNLHKVSAEVYDFNPRSKRCLEKCGYVVEGVQKEHRYRNGRRVDCYMLAVFKKPFLRLWKKYREKFLSKKQKK
jgi:RimJ/RimL family protein N-acetyltransferase